MLILAFSEGNQLKLTPATSNKQRFDEIWRAAKSGPIHVSIIWSVIQIVEGHFTVSLSTYCGCELQATVAFEGIFTKLQTKADALQTSPNTDCVAKFAMCLLGRQSGGYNRRMLGHEGCFYHWTRMLQWSQLGVLTNMIRRDSHNLMILLYPQYATYVAKRICVLARVELWNAWRCSVVAQAPNHAFRETRRGGMTEIEVSTRQLRWCHGSIRATFKDGQLVPVMLGKLCDNTLTVERVPQLEVLEADGAIFFVWPGNRRLLAFKELAKMKGDFLLKVIRKGALTSEHRGSPLILPRAMAVSESLFSQGIGTSYEFCFGGPLWLYAQSSGGGTRPEIVGIWGKAVSVLAGRKPQRTDGWLWQEAVSFHDIASQKSDVVSLSSCLDCMRYFTGMSSLLTGRQGTEPEGVVETLGGCSCSELESRLKTHLDASSRRCSAFELCSLAGLPDAAEVQQKLLDFLAQWPGIFEQVRCEFGLLTTTNYY